MTTTQIAVFDTNAGFLQWLGAAESHSAAIRAHLADVGFNEDVEYEFRLIDVDDGQAAALAAWQDAGAASPDYPKGLPSGAVYTSAQVCALLAAA